VRLLDNKRLVGQLAALERRTSATREKIDHPRGARTAPVAMLFNPATAPYAEYWLNPFKSRSSVPMV
jgi:hypothetical protein